MARRPLGRGAGVSRMRVLYSDEIRARRRYWAARTPQDPNTGGTRMEDCRRWAASTRDQATAFEAALLVGDPVVMDRSSIFDMLHAADDPRWQDFTDRTGDADDLFVLDEADRISPHTEPQHAGR